MIKINFFNLVILILFMLLSGCTNEKSVFGNYNEAKDYILVQEQLDNKGIIEEFKIGNQHLILFEKYDGDEVVFALTNIIELEDGSVKWDKTSSKISIKGTEDGRPVGTEYKTVENNNVSFLIGIYDELSFAELDDDIKKGIISIDEDRVIYYMVDVEI